MSLVKRLSEVVPNLRLGAWQSRPPMRSLSSFAMFGAAGLQGRVREVLPMQTLHTITQNLRAAPRFH